MTTEIAVQNVARTTVVQPSVLCVCLPSYERLALALCHSVATRLDTQLDSVGSGIVPASLCMVDALNHESYSAARCVGARNLFDCEQATRASQSRMHASRVSGDRITDRQWYALCSGVLKTLLAAHGNDAPPPTGYCQCNLLGVRPFPYHSATC